ncbi:YIP1 family protein [bacterium]|nr:YIP1 family protein [bacterium]
MQKYIENLYKILFENNFDNVFEDTTVIKAILTILWTSLFLFISKFNFANGGSIIFLFITTSFGYIFSIYFFWIVTGLFFEFVAKIFGKSGKIRKLLMLSSYCLLPYIFFAPLEIMKKFSDMGYFLGTKIEFLLFLWVIILYSKVLVKTYDLQKTSSYLLIFLPFVAFIFGFIWLIGSLFNLGYIYSV